MHSYRLRPGTRDARAIDVGGDLKGMLTSIFEEHSTLVEVPSRPTLKSTGFRVRPPGMLGRPQRALPPVRRYFPPRPMQSTSLGTDVAAAIIKVRNQRGLQAKGRG